MATSSDDMLGLREAADAFGVSVDTLRRRIRSGDLPEATKAEGKFGSTWLVPINDMALIAERERWALRINPDSGEAEASARPPAYAQGAAQPSAAPAQPPSSGPAGVMTDGIPMTPPNWAAPALSSENLDWVERLLAAESRATGAEAKVETLTGEALATERRLTQMTGDLEHERSEVRRLRIDLTNEEKARAVSEARNDELRKQLERERTDSVTRIDLVREEAYANAQRAEALASELGHAHASMGWWSRRRMQKPAKIQAWTINELRWSRF